MLYQRFDPDEKTPVQFVGVYTTHWRPEWGEPEAMFREYEPPEFTEEQKAQYPLEDWQDDVYNGGTVLSYQEWLEHSIERDRDELQAMR